MPYTARLVLAACVAALGLTACGSTPSGGHRLQVVAAENFWGSIASQLAGDRADVRSIVTNPDTDPHSYDPTASDARTMAGAQVAIVNGIGYDSWASHLLAANPDSSRVVLTVGDLLGLADGDNPHQWYSPPAVERVVDAISAAYAKADPSDAAYFAKRKQLFLTRSLASYHALLQQIRRQYAGAPVGYSESIFQPLGSYLGLRLLTPYSFAKAVAEGSDVSAADTRTVEAQLSRHLIRVWVFNGQNVTPEIDHLNSIARAEHIPIVTVTETLSPANLDFEQWQVAQLEQLRAALAQSAGG
ncbi:MAG TPA: zinc ABC transporter substrate-binding protein [Gaiellaceae bacterium]|jgi:zinc/manganese transport system substrate-binding protein|nr:zinc ABC transporter substrate-binding protein [Gaiellaceae bacterium]